MNMHDLQRAIGSFVNGQWSHIELEDWLAHGAQFFADSNDSRARALYGRAASLVAELAYGQVTEPDIRVELAEFARELGAIAQF